MSSLNVSNFEAVFRNSAIFSLQKSPPAPRMQLGTVCLFILSWSAVTNHQPAFFLPPWWIRGRCSLHRHLFPLQPSNPLLVLVTTTRCWTVGHQTRLLGLGWTMGLGMKYMLCGEWAAMWASTAQLGGRGGEKKQSGERKGGGPGPGVSGKGWVWACRIVPSSL